MVQTGDHTCKLRMYMGDSVISGPLLTTKSFIISKLCLVMVQNRVFRLHQFCVRQSVGKYAEERLFGILLVQPLLSDESNRLSIEYVYDNRDRTSDI